MLDRPLVLVDVDTQRDFLDPDGALCIAGSETIRPQLARLTQFARDHQIPVVATACAHEPGDAELARFAPHCMAGTRGEQRVEETAWPGGVVVAPEGRLPGALPAHLTIQKREFSVFSHPDAQRILSLYERNRPTFVVYGVATDYCVRAAVEGLLAMSARVALVVDATWPIDRSNEPELLSRLARQGVLLTLTEVVCSA